MWSIWVLTEFYTSCWNIVGLEVCDVADEFFTSGQLLRQWNATTFVLISNIPTACRTTDSRPISCLNTLYKVIAKLLAKRL